MATDWCCCCCCCCLFLLLLLLVLLLLLLLSLLVLLLLLLFFALQKLSSPQGRLSAPENLRAGLYAGKGKAVHGRGRGGLYTCVVRVVVRRGAFWGAGAIPPAGAIWSGEMAGNRRVAAGGAHFAHYFI